MYLYTAPFKPEPTSFALHWIEVPSGNSSKFGTTGSAAEESAPAPAPAPAPVPDESSSPPPIIIIAELEEQHTIIPTAAAIIGIDIFVFITILWDFFTDMIGVSTYQ
jgi:hypothetical protein